MALLRHLLLLGALSLLVSCGTMIQTKVSTFHALDGRPLPTFAMVPYENQKGSLEYQTYAQEVRRNLSERGFKEAPFNQANVAVFLDYRIDDGRQITYSYPIVGQTGVASSYTTGSVSVYGNTAYVQGTTTNTPQYGVVGTGTGSYTQFRRVVRLDMVDIAASQGRDNVQKVYEATVISDGTTGDLPTVMPFLLKALFEQFPAPSGSVRSVTVPMQR